MAAIVLLGACGTGDETAPDQERGIGEAEASAARQLFQDENCTMCHGEMTQGMEELGPALRDLAPYWDRDRLASYLEDPPAFAEANPDFDERRDIAFDLEIPAYDSLSVEQRHILADWLLTR